MFVSLQSYSTKVAGRGSSAGNSDSRCSTLAIPPASPKMVPASRCPGTRLPLCQGSSPSRDCSDTAVRLLGLVSSPSINETQLVHDCLHQPWWHQRLLTPLLGASEKAARGGPVLFIHIAHHHGVIATVLRVSTVIPGDPYRASDQTGGLHAGLPFLLDPHILTVMEEIGDGRTQALPDASRLFSATLGSLPPYPTMELPSVRRGTFRASKAAVFCAATKVLPSLLHSPIGVTGERLGNATAVMDDSTSSTAHSAARSRYSADMELPYRRAYPAVDAGVSSSSARPTAGLSSVAKVSRGGGATGAYPCSHSSRVNPRCSHGAMASMPRWSQPLCTPCGISPSRIFCSRRYHGELLILSLSQAWCFSCRGSFIFSGSPAHREVRYQVDRSCPTLSQGAGSCSKGVSLGSVPSRCKSASSSLMLIRPLRPACWAPAVPRCRRRWGW